MLFNFLKKQDKTPKNEPETMATDIAAPSNPSTITEAQAEEPTPDTAEDNAWAYNQVVKEHFFNPQNVLWDESDFKADGTGMAGSPACGDMMTVWITVNPEGTKIKECKWRTFGCASAIASTSMMSVMVTENGGMDLKTGMNLKPEQIVDRLGGIPDEKFHCSVLGHIALREAINDYFTKTNHAA